MIVTEHLITRSVFRRAGAIGVEYPSAEAAYYTEAIVRYQRKRGPLGRAPINAKIERYARWLRRADEREAQPCT